MRAFFFLRGVLLLFEAQLALVLRALHILAQCPLGAGHALQQGVILLLQTSNLRRGLIKFLACGVYLLPQTDHLELSAHLAAAPFISLLAECHFFCIPFL